MSADNFMAILSTPADNGREFRVTMLYDSDSYQEGGFCSRHGNGEREALMDMARELWADPEFTSTNEESAWDFALNFCDNHVVEYGVQFFDLPLKF